MEKRLIIALILSIGVFVLWSIIFPPQIPERLPETQSVDSVETLIPEAESSETAVIDEGEEAVAEFASVSADSEERISVETDEWLVVLTNKGARVVSWKLKNYMDDNGDPLELVNSSEVEKNNLPLGLILDKTENSEAVNNSYYAVTQSEGEEGRTIVFEFADGYGLRVLKTFVVPEKGYLFSYSAEVFSGNNPVDSYSFWGPGFGDKKEGESKNRFYLTDQVVLSSANNEIERLKTPKLLKKLNSADGTGFLSGMIWKSLPYQYSNGDMKLEMPLKWVSVGDNYFAVVFLGDSFRTLNIRGFDGEPDKKGRIFKTTFTLGVPSSGIRSLYIGPREYKALKELGGNYDQLIDLGVFWFIAKPLMLALEYFYKYIANYGVCIILLTIIIKLLLYPLTHKSFVSMKKMQKLQPKMKAIQKKYKKKDAESREKLSREMMDLYKTEGVNPMGGCLPMLLQLPVLWAFYNLLTVSIALRHAPFIMWIKDLSMPDPYYITPIVMGATMYIQQSMATTPAGNEMQQKMFKMMPVIFTVMFLNFPSGLVLYWLTNNILTIGQQYLINKYTD